MVAKEISGMKGKKEVRSRKKKRRVVLLQADEEEAEQENRQGWC